LEIRLKSWKPTDGRNPEMDEKIDVIPKFIEASNILQIEDRKMHGNQ
jgi:hypothetical protein